jgi:hypothetical protein
MLYRLVETKVSKERAASIFRVLNSTLIVLRISEN